MARAMGYLLAPFWLWLFFLSALHAEPMLFAYFKEPANMGVFFATSNDGYHFQPLNGGKPWLPVEHADELMRDPFLTRGPDKEFHMVWTWGWRGTSLGYAHSPDLVHWSESQWMIVWSRRVPAHVGNRIYRAWTADFKTITKPELFWDPGYPVIDATIFEDETVEPVHRRRLTGQHGALPAAMAQSLPDLYHDEKHGDPPYLSEAGWRPLLNGRDLAGWHAENNAAHEWFTSASVEWRRVFSPTHLTAKAAAGDRIVNGKEGKTANLVTDQKFGSFELYLEFLLAKGSNSGVFLHGLYEIQVFDSFGYDGPLTVGDCGGIYEQVEGGGGSPPSRNAARAPGEWQSLRIWFQGPQFDAAGKMMARPKVMRVMLNEVQVQGEFTLPGPTLSHMNIAPAAKNPIMLQGDHGPVAYRNIYVKEMD